MIGTRTRKILRDISSRKLRTFLVSLSIFIGVLGVVTLISASNLLVSQLENDIRPERLSMMDISLLSRGGANIDNEQFLETVRQQPNVTEAEASVVTLLFWRATGDTEFEEGTLVARGKSYDEAFIQPARLLEGQYPAVTDDPTQVEVAVERRFADKNGYKIGDTFEVRVLGRSGEDPEATPGEEARTVTAKVVGIVFQPYRVITDLELGASDSLVFFNIADMPQITGSNAFNVLNIRFENYAQAEDGVLAMENAISNATSYIPFRSSTADPANNDQINQTRSTGTILVILAVLALLVSGFLIINVVNAIVSEQRRQIGVMKSIGASRADTFFMYCGIAGIYGLFATIPGVLLGIPGGYYAAQGLAGFYETIIDDFKIVPIAVVLGLVLGLLIPILASLPPVFLGSRVSIMDALTDLGIGGKFGRGRFERLIGNLPLPIWLRQSINNAFQKKGRLALTGLTLTIASAAFMGIFSVFFGLTQLAGTLFDTYGYELAILPEQSQDFDRIADLINTNVDGVKAVEPGVRLAININDFEAPPVVAGPPGTNATGWNTRNAEVFNLELLEGTGWQDDPDRDGIVIASRIQKYMDVGIGDSLTISAGGNTQDFEIIGVVNWPFNDIWFKWETLAQFGNITAPDSDQSYSNAINILLDDPNPTPDSVDKKGDEIKELLLKNGINSRIDNVVKSAETITTIVTIFGVVLSLASFLIAAVGGVGLLTTLSISVFERQKEIGVMRSVGATSRSIATQFLTEGLVVGIVSWLVAIPISLVIRGQLLKNLPFGEVFEISYPPITLVIGLVGMIGLVAVASLWPSFIASRKTVSEILRYQ